MPQLDILRQRACQGSFVNITAEESLPEQFQRWNYLWSHERHIGSPKDVIIFFEVFWLYCSGLIYADCVGLIMQNIWLQQNDFFSSVPVLV